MKIYVVVRTRNEKDRIAQFCEAYENADKILVADGGSEDNTIEIAQRYPNVEVRNFTKRVQLAKGHWRNNDSAHANFLFEWAREESPDWIIYDDCDCRPNKLLKNDYRMFLEETDKDYVMAVRLYVWGKDGLHFPYMAKPGETHTQWETSLYGWRGHLDFKTVDVPPAYTFKVGDRDIVDLHKESILEIFPPHCLVHYSWDDEDKVAEKVRVYDESGLIPGMLGPKKFAGPLENLPEWARE